MNPEPESDISKILEQLGAPPEPELSQAEKKFREDVDRTLEELGTPPDSALL